MWLRRGAHFIQRMVVFKMTSSLRCIEHKKTRRVSYFQFTGWYVAPNERSTVPRARACVARRWFDRCDGRACAVVKDLGYEPLKTHY